MILQNKVTFYLKYFLISKVFRRPIIFRDYLGNKYWQYPNDDIFFNYKRNAVSDAGRVIKLSQKLIKKNWVCIDIGAFNGDTTIPLWRKVGRKGLVYSIEADPDNISVIKRNLRLNSMPDGYVYNYAICSKNKKVKLHVIPNQNGWQSLGSPVKDKIAVPKGTKVIIKTISGITLKNFCTINKIKKIDLLKVDVEGAEIDVFKGAKNLLLERRIKNIIFEISPQMLKWFNRKPDDVIKYLRNFGYRIYRITDQSEIESFDGLWSGGWGDCLATYYGK